MAEAGDLNIYRMTWKNPINWTDPSGMSVAAERGLIDSIGLILIQGGKVATQAMLSTGIRTAQFLASREGVAASTIAAGLACTFFTLADAVAQAGPNTQIVGINPASCGVVAKRNDDRGSGSGAGNPNFPPSNFPPDDDCKELYVQCTDGNWGPLHCYDCFNHCMTNKIWPFSMCSPDSPNKFPMSKRWKKGKIK